MSFIYLVAWKEGTMCIKIYDGELSAGYYMIVGEV